jgi:hypothetical protein
MASIEREAAFYLGRRYNLATRRVIADEPLLYDARDLTTHAVCVGMTGSGKTGLCVDLIEEAALDGVPAIVIDPKGDMTNLLLTFPELRPADFEPWVNVDDARRKGQTVEEYAAATAQTWAEGLAEWDQGPERIRRLKEAAEWVIYTPGSDAGIPVSVMQSLRAPDLSWDDEEEALRELIACTVSALLGLVGVAADPVRSREHILLSHIVEHAWRRGEDLDLARLIEAIQRPPMRTLGVLDIDSFYPERDRMDLVMRLNSVAASPSFGNWLKGAPLDIASLTHTAGGRPRVSVFYIAHLNDAERMFFVTLLLEQVVTWMRRLSGTTSLRCLLYFDEVFGYLPPHPADPPSKRPLLTLLKMARAFGIGVVLATQNPVDLDYKSLTNAGTWFIGKLQTDRDKARVLEGMEGVVSEQGTLLDRSYLDRTISSLDSRVFILHNVHEERPELFYTRWALSYLRGPLTRSQVRTLMEPLKERAPEATRATVATPAPAPAASPAPKVPPGYASVPPAVNARVPQYHLLVVLAPQRAAEEAGVSLGPHAGQPPLVYVPYLLGSATVRYGKAGRERSARKHVTCLVPLPPAHAVVDWRRHLVDDRVAGDVRSTAPEGGLYAPLADGMSDSPPYTRFRDSFADYIYHNVALPIWVHRELGLESVADEEEATFRERCRQEAARRMAAEVDTLTTRFSRDVERLRSKLEAEERELARDIVEHEERKRDELLSAGESLIGTLLGRRSSRRLSQASTKRRLTQRAKADVEESEEVIAKLKAQIAEREREHEEALHAVRRRWEEAAERVEEAELHPTRSGIHITVFGLVWVPLWLLGDNLDVRVPAYPWDQ